MRIFIGHIIPKHLISKFQQSQAGNNFSYNLIEGNCFDKVFSILPTNIIGNFDKSSYPIPIDLYYCKLFRKVKLGIIFALFFENIWLQFKLKKNSKIWFYNLTLLNVISFIIIKFFRPSLKAYIIILDYTPAKYKLSIQSLILWLMNKADGTICLSTSKDFTCKNTVCLPGVTSHLNVDYPVITNPTKTFLLSGVINDSISMISTILEVFSLLPDCELLITGHVEDKKLIENYTEKFPNIHLKGMLPYEEYLELMHTVTYCLSTRNPKYPENQNNFPSKIIEHLLHNRIIISTLQYNQISDINYFNIPTEIDNMIISLSNISNMKSGALLQYANQSHKVKALFNQEIWKQNIENIELRSLSLKS